VTVPVRISSLLPGLPGRGVLLADPADTGVVREHAGRGRVRRLRVAHPGGLPERLEEAHEVVDDVEAGGPFAHPRNDGVTFGNREGLLPAEDRGYYREFTVDTPGLDHRGERRIVIGGPDPREPQHWYYTDDHYESFCEFGAPAAGSAT
jgi:guanyl-specific ribonuclease Sa